MNSFATDTENRAFALAAEFIHNTSRSVFLTGKAGTGKTTFLKHIRNTVSKKTAVVAPTGVAAINAGGMTMHSLFQLPFGLFIPGHTSFEGRVQITNRNSLFQNLRLSQEKRELLQELELLIIDEVSMVRCDMLDATDAILRFVRKSNRSFGGVQVLFIGDLFQLPPVAINEEWAILNDHYESPFFFHAKVIQQNPPLCIELQKIYRQNEVEYIDLLNHIRHNDITDEVIARLNERYSPEASDIRDCITLTTHNYKADTINREELRKLPGRAYQYTGLVDGDFSDKSFPAELTLSLKVGAKVMFIRNDTDEEKKYYNGKLATITHLEDEKIEAQFDDNREVYELKREVWRNIRYQYDREEDVLSEEELGSFSQYPIRLAWAITIHKSQGLTFQKVVVDAGDSFAAGQVYVALSRCTSLQGLILRSRITRQQISTDERVLEHARQLENEDALQQLLQKERESFEHDQLVALFDIEKIYEELLRWKEGLAGKKLPDPAATQQLAEELVQRAAELLEVSRKFRGKLEDLFMQARHSGDFEPVYERTEKAVLYFNDSLRAEILDKLKAHIREITDKAKVKKYIREVKAMALLVQKKGDKIRSAHLGSRKFYTGATVESQEEEISLKPTKIKKEKGQSARETLQLLLAGNDVNTVATIRGLAKTTIEGHLADFVLTGEIDVEKVVQPRKISVILKALDENQEIGMGLLKQKLGDQYSYGEIKAVMNYKALQKNQP